MISEFTIFAEIKPGHADALRKDLATLSGGKDDERARAALHEIGTLHEGRHVIFDNDTRFMFCSSFDGSWDTYIDDFAKTVMGDRFSTIFAHCEGFPGIHDPGVKDWFVARQEPAGLFITSCPDLTMQQIWKDQRVDEAFEEVLDTPEFRAALENPANAGLVSTPAFQKLLEEASV
ncbi:MULTISPECIES: hypothetical protein [Streptomyces]|uniref:Barstar (Barnase inhibitor) n=1 Tax=Streptomyces mirabilis TaxID=68239 RepID=A0ABU3UGZ4_9ACTN|nr:MULTISPECIES: hypothetical protein [Streptomyces]MCX4613099.1 hypothetical protein [Streptomyces mirabilis]MDU8993196.1 hypothetical protein [Streptomyces mirabilis]